MKKFCDICGKPSGMYPLCKDCLELKNQGLVIKCPTCNAWRKKDEPCQSCKDDPITRTIAEEPKEVEDTNELKCLICNKPSNGKHFCPTCYAKYRNRAVDIRITNCYQTEVLDEYGNLNYTCLDETKVRSRAERDIADWLYHNKVRYIYEKFVNYKDEETGLPKTLKPDFYLPDYDFYIEYNEYTKPFYVNSKSYAQKIYKKLNLTVHIMTEKELRNISAFLKPLLDMP